MKLPPFLTRTLCSKLQANWRSGLRAEKAGKEFDPVPVCKLDAPWQMTSWYLTEQDPDNPDIVFGLEVDRLRQVAAFNEFSISDFRTYGGPAGERVERDYSAELRKTVGTLFEEAEAEFSGEPA